MNINNYKVPDLEKAYRLIYENASELVQESQILFKRQKYARAFTLSHLATEELSKLPIIFRVATDVHFGIEVDWKQVNKDLRDHEGKLRRRFLQQNMIASLFGNNQFRKDLLQVAYGSAKEYNQLKNASLYSGIHENEFKKPSSIINKDLAEMSLNLAKSQLKMVQQGNFHIKGFVDSFSTLTKEQYLYQTKELPKKLFE